MEGELHYFLDKCFVTILNGMHPSFCRYAFSEDGGPTIIPKPDPYIPIGQRDGPSHLDLHKINTLYDCGRFTHTHTHDQLIQNY